MNSDLITLAAVLAGFFSALVAIMMVYLKRVLEGRYNQELQRAELEKLRESFERQITELTYRLVSTEARWRDVHQLQVSGQQAVDTQIEPNNIRLSDFFKNLGINDVVEIDRNLVFVLTPFGTEEYETFEAIRRVCNSVGLKCLRGDEEFVRSGDILTHVLRNMIQARIVIANINGRNPNVFYELGISHAIAKPTILVGKNLSEAPFDVQSKRIILYEDRQELETRLTQELTRTLVVA